MAFSTHAPDVARSNRSGLRGAGVLPVYGLLAALLLAFVVYVAVRPLGVRITVVDGWGVDLFELTAAALCVGASRRRGAVQAAPMALGAALAIWALGDIALTIETLGGASPGTPSVADGFYIAFFPLSYVAVVLFIRGERRRLSSPNWLDGAVAGLGAAAVLSAFAFASIARTAHASVLATAVDLAYPVGDVILLLLVVGGTAVMSGRHKGPWLLLALGFGFNMFGDTSSLLHDSLGGPHVGTLIDAVAWPTSSLLLSAAMWLSPGAPDPLTPRKPPGFVLPGLAAGAGLVVLFLSSLYPIARVATILAGATLLLVVLRTWLSVRELRAQARHRHLQSVTDPLTGLANRRRLFDVLAALCAEPEDEWPPFAFLFLDLNGFKRVNDCFGHVVGDDVLRRVGERLQEPLRPSDILARVGGDEFAVLMVGSGPAEALAMAERLTSALALPFALDAVRAEIGASIGIAHAPQDARDNEGLLACADAAMYRAKLAGSPFARYEHELDRGGDKLRLADELSTAIDRGQLTLHYQPQLELADGEVSGVEALVRWQHPDRGLIPPLTFLSLAEQAGLMPRLTRWVLDSALGQSRQWRSAGLALRVSVNVSAGDLVDPSFPDTVLALLGAHGVAPETLVLEITETSIIREFERARHAVIRLREVGVQVSIDDFGAGFTSLAYLNDLAVSELKLDRCLIAPLVAHRRTRDSELVRATIELGHALGLKVVAEGIEDQATLALLRALGCDAAQGYEIGRPVPAEALTVVVPVPRPVAAMRRSSTRTAARTARV